MQLISRYLVDFGRIFSSVKQYKCLWNSFQEDFKELQNNMLFYKLSKLSLQYSQDILNFSITINILLTCNKY